MTRVMEQVSGRAESPGVAPSFPYCPFLFWVKGSEKYKVQVPGHGGIALVQALQRQSQSCIPRTLSHALDQLGLEAGWVCHR